MHRNKVNSSFGRRETASKPVIWSAAKPPFGPSLMGEKSLRPPIRDLKLKNSYFHFTKDLFFEKTNSSGAELY